MGRRLGAEKANCLEQETVFLRVRWEGGCGAYKNGDQFSNLGAEGTVLSVKVGNRR